MSLESATTREANPNWPIVYQLVEFLQFEVREVNGGTLPNLEDLMAAVTLVLSGDVSYWRVFKF